MTLTVHPPQESLQIAADLNCVAGFLAADDFHDRPIAPATMQDVLGVPVADVLVLLGNSVLHTAEHAFAAMRNGVARHLLISGGRGHSTRFLYESLAEAPAYRVVESAGRAEADLLGELATRFAGIPPDLITLETESSNCGENAQYSFAVLQKSGIAANHIILVQDPTMQLRSSAGFRKVWGDAGVPLLLANYPTFVPEVRVESGGLVFGVPDVKGLWPMERFVSLVLGEIPRLRDDANGYGPRGRGYIEHVEIPDAVLAAHARLADRFPDMMR